MTVILIALATFVATFIGGSLAIRLKDRLHLILGFSAGAVIGVAFFDLLPEAVRFGTVYWNMDTIALAIAGGFFAYLLLDRLVLLHNHSELEAEEPHRGGSLGAVTLLAHSFLDGIAIGIAFQASAAIGFVVAAAVLVHDFSDGINTVAVVLRRDGSSKSALVWLLLDAAAPVLGAALTLLFVIPGSLIGIVLSVFVGTFLYLGASDLIPESQHRHPRALTTVMTVFGAAVLWMVVQIAG